jgi:hypothetical protein
MAKAIGVPKTEDFMLKLFDQFVTGPHFKVAHMKVAPSRSIDIFRLLNLSFNRP